MSRPTVRLGRDGVRPEDVEAVACGLATLEATPEVMQDVERSFHHLQQLMAGRFRVYGVTTGYGPLAGHWLGPDHAERLQRNLIHHLRTGVGPALPGATARAVLMARVVSLACGHSGVQPETLQRLTAGLNRGLIPRIPSQGTVGASGDLTPLAHLTGVLMGEGEAAVDGDPETAGRDEPAWREAASVLARLGLEPLRPAGKDALALVNGTSAMTGIAAMNACLARRLGGWALRLQALHAEVFRARTEAWAPELARVRPHPGQQAVTAVLQRLLEGSRRVTHGDGVPPRLPEPDGTAADDTGGQALPQDVYSVRCAPQWFGAVADTLGFHDRVVARELNGVTDNPVLFDPPARGETPRAFHGGNFQGLHVASASDSLTQAVIQLAIHAERRIARLCDPARNQGLPAFLHGGAPGLNSGFMGAQVTASALLAEMRMRAVPASVQSISTNAGNQDVVSLGTIAARNAAWMLEQLASLLAVESLVLAQAFEATGADETGADAFSPAARALHRRIRAGYPALDGDRPLAEEIRALAVELRDPSGPGAGLGDLDWVPEGP